MLLAFHYNFVFNVTFSIVRPKRMTAVVLLWGGGCLFSALSEQVVTRATCCRNASIAETVHLLVGMGSLFVIYLELLKNTLRELIIGK